MKYEIKWNLKDSCVLGCNAIRFGRSLSAFQRKILAPFQNWRVSPGGMQHSNCLLISCLTELASGASLELNVSRTHLSTIFLCMSMQIGVVVMLWIYILEVLSLNLHCNTTVLIEVFVTFLSPFRQIPGQYFD